MRNARDRRRHIIIGLCIVLVLMAVGYAAFNQLLNINGTAQTTNGWCVGFDNTKTNTYTVTKGKQSGQNPTGSMTYSGNVCSTKLQPSVSLASGFSQPGDQVEYTLTIKNASSVVASIKSILIDNQNITADKTITKGNIEYSVEVPEESISVNGETTMKVIARFQNERDITGTYSGETQTVEVKLNVEQYSDEGTFSSGIISRFNTNVMLDGQFANGRAVLWYSSDKYNSLMEALLSEEIFFKESDCQSSETNCVSEAPIIWFSTEYSSGTEAFKNGSFYLDESSCLYENDNCRSDYVDLSTGNFVNDPSELNSNYYLKHFLEGNIVSESAVCFIYGGEEFCLVGAEDGYYYQYNLGKLQQAFGDNVSSYCTGDENYISCRNVPGFYEIFLNRYGEVDISGNSSQRCTVSEGTANPSYCVQ